MPYPYLHPFAPRMVAFRARCVPFPLNQHHARTSALFMSNIPLITEGSCIRGTQTGNITITVLSVNTMATSAEFCFPIRELADDSIKLTPFNVSSVD